VYTENKRKNTVTDSSADSVDDAQEKSLRWLLEMDLDDPEEKLFSVSGNEYLDQGLSDYEAEVASRPMFCGSTTSDDLTSYVAEEIVISSEGEKSDIYSADQRNGVSDEDETSSDECMAVDYSTGWQVVEHELLDQVVSEGEDILGLAADDDIGEKFIAIKRVKRSMDDEAIAAAAPTDNVVADAAASVEDAPQDNTDLVEPVEYDLTGITLAEQVNTNAADSDLMADAVAEDESGSMDLDLEDLDIEQSEPVVTAQGDVADQPLALSEAPVTGLVAVPGAHSVANEDVIPGVEDASSPVEPAAETARAEDVVDYISNTQPPVDDDAFDQYLLAGEHLQSIFSGQEELVVEPAQGVVSVDPSAGDCIDYHEDFLSMEGIDRGNVSAVAGVISGAMEEISELARERIRERGLASEALAVDVMLGTDAESIKRCYAEGFEPVTAICRQLPLALRELQQPELDTIYLRLFNGQTNENWNDLFSVDPVMDVQDMEAACDDLLAEEGATVPAEVATDQAEQTNGVDWLAVEGFGEDSLEQDFALGIDLPAVEQELDIDEVFSGTVSATGVADEICGVDVDEFDLAQPQEEPLENLPAAEQQAPVETQQESVGASWCIPEGIAFNYSSQSSTEIFSDFLDAFIEESTSEVEKLEDAFGEWEKNPADDAALAPVARTLHTIKGIAKGVGLQRYGTLIHNFETLLEAMPRPQDGLEGEYFRMVNAWLDAAVRGLEHVRENRCDVASEFPVQAVVATPSRVVEQEPLEAQQEPQQEPQQVTEPARPISQSKPAADSRQKKRDQQLADEGAKALAAQQSVRITAEKLDHLLNLTSQAQQLGVRSAQSSTRGKRAAAELRGRLSSVRAQIATIADRSLLQVNSRGGRTTPDLDALEMDQYSELQEAASILREGVEDLADLVELANRQNTMVETLLKQQASVITSISSSIQAARVVPVSRLMPGLRRIVRTVSTDLNKSVSFKVLNEAGALDRDHYARCQIILEHMVRNAMDHGIETPEDRLAQGKPTAGRITIDVRKSGGDYIIRLSDDGRGIDPDAIRESAYKKRLDVDVDKLTDDQVMRLIFHKGFSTANTLSEISGRGVGMDIVMSELQQLGGDIQIQSTVGLGTCFEIRIPANVTVNGALLVAAGEQSYAIPLNGLIAVEQVPVQDFYSAVESGETLSLLDMDCEPAYLATLCQREPLPDRGTWGATVPVIIAGTEERYMAIAIDNVEEALELVVRSLGSQFSGVPGLAGAATTADGDAIVALDLNLLVGSVDAGGISTIAVERPEEAGLLALVVDDSRTQRMVATSQLDTVGVETVTAENGMVAIDLLNSTHRLPDVVLLDVEMPVQDGIETLREIRKSRRFGHLAVIMVTSRTGSKHRALAKEAGCNGYMGKPFNFQALVERISELTGHELHHS
jgi:chemosensory pili system protein ChpA (sensor histidine kinase/response regulator)